MVIPALVYLSDIPKLTDRFPDPLLIVIGSGAIGGIPYLIIATSILIWSRKKTEAQIRRALLLSPFGMIVLFGIATIIIVSLQIFQWMNGTDIRPMNDYMTGAGTIFLILSGFSLVFGYAYVGIFFAIVRLVRGHSYSNRLR